jgi:hypothetical protein
MTELSWPDAHALIRAELADTTLLDFLSANAAGSIVTWMAREVTGFQADQPIIRLLSLQPLREHALGGILSQEWQDRVCAAVQDAIEQHWLPWKRAHPPSVAPQ